MTESYQRLRLRTIVDPLDPSKRIKVRRWKLLKDLPQHGIQAGAVTGYIGENIEPSSLNKNCWFAYNTIVYGEISFRDNAAVLDNSIVRGPSKPLSNPSARPWLLIEGNAIIQNDAIVGLYGKPTQLSEVFKISDDVKISGKARVGLPGHISGNVSIYGNAEVGSHTFISGNVEIYDLARVKNFVSIKGNVHIHDYAFVGCRVKIDGDVNIKDRERLSTGINIIDGKLVDSRRILSKEVSKLATLDDVKLAQQELSLTKMKDAKEQKPADVLPILDDKTTSDEIFPWVERFNKVQEDINAYNSDIVKIIKYPTMVDATHEVTADMICALKDAEVLAQGNNTEKFMSAVSLLERKFFIAESYAKKMMATVFTEDERKKAFKAKDLFAIACDDVSSENEKRSAFKQGFLQLEGVVSVPDIAKSTLQAKIGLAEIEM